MVLKDVVYVTHDSSLILDMGYPELAGFLCSFAQVVSQVLRRYTGLVEDRLERGFLVIQHRC